MDFKWLHRLILHITHMKSPPGGNAFYKLKKNKTKTLNTVCVIYTSSSGHKLPSCFIFCIELSLDIEHAKAFIFGKKKKKLTLWAMIYTILCLTCPGKKREHAP